jgi:hypothetical protein
MVALAPVTEPPEGMAVELKYLAVLPFCTWKSYVTEVLLE